MKAWYYYLFVHKGVIDLKNVPEKHLAIRKNKIENEIKKTFESITQNLNSSNKFRYLLRELKINALEDILYTNHNDILKLKGHISPFPSNNEIIKKFQELDEQYKYFPKNEQSKENFIAFFKACKLVADYEEFNNTDDNDVAYQHAYKMMVLFGIKDNSPLEFSENFISQNKGNHSKPIHDLLVHDIPVNEPSINLSKWQKLIRENGKSGIKIFQRAPAIEELLKRVPNHLKEAQEAMSKLSYKRFSEYPEFATLCLEYNVDEEVFNRCLTIKPKEKSDNLPQISIDGKTINHPGYHLVKLPIDDPRAYILGKITNCCQSIGGHSEECVIDGITRENNGFYVLLKAKKSIEGKNPLLKNNQINYEEYEIAGQGYAWLSRLNNLTFDSWENLTPDVDNKISILLLKKFAQKVMEQNEGILRMTIGTGGKTPEGFSEQKVKEPEQIMEGIQYEDSKQQWLIGTNEEVIIKLSKQLEKDIQSVVGKNVKIILNATKQEQWLRELFINQYDYYSKNIKDYNSLLIKSQKNIKLLEMYYILHQSNILTTESIECIIEDQYLHTYNLLILLSKKNPDLIENTVSSLIKVSNETDRFSKTLMILYKNDSNLIKDQQIIQPLIEASGYIKFLNRILSILNNSNPDLMKDKNFIRLLADNKTNLQSIWWAMFECNIPELMTTTYVTLLVSDPICAQSIYDELVTLYKETPELINNTTIELLAKTYYMVKKIGWSFLENYELTESYHFNSWGKEVEKLTQILIICYRVNNQMILNSHLIQLLNENMKIITLVSNAVNQLCVDDWQKWVTEEMIMAVIEVGDNASVMVSILIKLHDSDLCNSKNIKTVQELLIKGNDKECIFNEIATNMKQTETPLTKLSIFIDTKNNKENASSETLLKPGPDNN